MAGLRRYAGQTLSRAEAVMDFSAYRLLRRDDYYGQPNRKALARFSFLIRRVTHKGSRF